MPTGIGDKIEWKRKIIANSVKNLRPLYRNKNTSFLPLASVKTPQSIELTLHLEFILLQYISDGGFVGATEDWMVTKAKSDIVHGQGMIAPLVVDIEKLEKQIRKDIYNLLGRAAEEVMIKDGVLIVDVDVLVKYKPSLTIEKVILDLERFILAAVNKFLQKPIKMKQKRRRTLQEKLDDWITKHIPFNHFGGRMFSSSINGLRTVELKFGQTSISILQSGWGKDTYSVRRNHLWPMGLERYKRQFLSALPEGVKYIEMQLEGM